MSFFTQFRDNVTRNSLIALQQQIYQPSPPTPQPTWVTPTVGGMLDNNAAVITAHPVTQPTADPALKNSAGGIQLDSKASTTYLIAGGVFLLAAGVLFATLKNER